MAHNNHLGGKSVKIVPRNGVTSYLNQLTNQIVVQTNQWQDSDVLIRCSDGRILSSNRHILAQGSILFRNLFGSLCDCITYLPVVFDILCPDFSSANLEKVIELIQTGEVILENVSVGHINEMKSILQEFQISIPFVIDEDCQLAEEESEVEWLNMESDDDNLNQFGTDSLLFENAIEEDDHKIIEEQKLETEQTPRSKQHIRKMYKSRKKNTKNRVEENTKPKKIESVQSRRETLRNRTRQRKTIDKSKYMELRNKIIYKKKLSRMNSGELARFVVDDSNEDDDVEDDDVEDDDVEDDEIDVYSESKSESSQTPESPVYKVTSIKLRMKKESQKTLKNNFDIIAPMMDNDDTIFDLSNFMFYDCKNCQKVFEDIEELERHIFVMHEDQELIECNICDSSFSTNLDLDVHMKTEHETIRCNLCQQIFDQNSSFEDHVITEHERKSFNCKICDQAFPYRLHLRAHILDAHVYPKNSEEQE